MQHVTTRTEISWTPKHTITSGSVPGVAWARYWFKQWYCGPEPFYFFSCFILLTTVNCGCKYISPGSTRENRKECSDGVERYRDHSDLMGPCLKQNTFSNGSSDQFTWNGKDHIPWAKFQGRTGTCPYVRVFIKRSLCFSFFLSIYLSFSILSFFCNPINLV
jgi:hypothetical protein